MFIGGGVKNDFWLILMEYTVQQSGLLNLSKNWDVIMKLPFMMEFHLDLIKTGLA